VLAPIIFWCMSFMAFMRGSMVDMGMDAPALPIPGDAGTAVVVPGFAQAVARLATDSATRVRNAVMQNS
jgi:hypothetical protein